MLNKQFIAFIPITINRLFIEPIKSQNIDAPTSDELYEDKNYVQALDQFRREEKEYPDDILLKYQIGVCYLKFIRVLF